MATLRALLCIALHDGSDMHPFRGEVRCRVCQRVRPVRWNEPQEQSETKRESPAGAVAEVVR
ncbi:MAG TPA: hypothetical protein VN737_04350 [Bryobacteraceae bacterium]|nr:hypothetical protein [Bryobacteraceae bacterium]